MIRRRRLVLLLLSSCLIQVFPGYAVTQELTTISTSLPLITNYTQYAQFPTYPQIVRIRYLEGDVRVLRGKKGCF
jgi:hypothetical protein